MRVQKQQKTARDRRNRRMLKNHPGSNRCPSCLFGDSSVMEPLKNYG